MTAVRRKWTAAVNVMGLVVVQSELQEQLSGFCRCWSEAVSRKNEPSDRQAFFRTALPGLLAQRELFCGSGILRGRPLIRIIRQATIFDNEIVLYRDRGRRFSRAALYLGRRRAHPGPRSQFLGRLRLGFGKLEVVRYRREDDGADPGSARLALFRPRRCCSRGRPK